MMTDTLAKPAVLLVEDNYRLSEELKLYLTEEGFDVRCADCGEAMDQALKKRTADVLILDLNLPEEDGISIVKRIRTSLPEVRVLILTARTMSSDKVMGYESGADVYMTKPARPAELAAAVKNLYGRMTPTTSQDRWILNTKMMTLQFNKLPPISLTYMENELLKILALNQGSVHIDTIQTMLLDEGLDSEEGSARFKFRLEVLISRLRAKLKPHLGDINPIKSVRGKGYQISFELQIH
jgi:DNA-binding response OmpR family regulator